MEPACFHNEPEENAERFSSGDLSGQVNVVSARVVSHSLSCFLVRCTM